MGPLHLPEPTTETWTKCAEGFNYSWGFPNCIGSIDGKHITVKCPRKSGSNYWSYLNKFSLVLMAIVGPDYRFIAIDIGGYGKNSDGGIFETSNMGQRFEANSMNVPTPENLPGQNTPCPYVLVGDEAFALKPYLMRPFPYRQARNDARKGKFNDKLCTARRVVENAFGILVHKWRIFCRPIETKVSTTKLLVFTACILHNFLRSRKCDDAQTEPSQRQRAFRNVAQDCRRATSAAFSIREMFVDYFSSD